MKKIFLTLAILLISTSIRAAGPGRPVDLMVEYQSSPLAIDVPSPRFSWELSATERGAAQSAYRIMVARSADDLATGKNLAWDSGRIESSQSVGIAYAGAPLVGRTRYYWKVRVWDESGAALPDSAPAAFCTGALSPDDWSAQWIWEDDQVKPNDYAYFRTDLVLPADPVDAVALVTAHNLFTLFVNGRRVSGYVNPGSSNPYKDKYYLAYQLAPFLKKGANAVAVIAYYKGVDGQNFVKAVPGMIFDARVKMNDGQAMTLASGNGWKVPATTPYDESAPFTNLRKHTAAEYFDARQEPAGWKDAGFDDSGWRPATVVHPDYTLRAQAVPEGNVDQVIDAKSIRRALPGVYELDFGEELSGWARLNVTGPAGDVVRMRYSDRLLLGRVSHSTANEPTNTYFDQYTLSGNGAETWEPQFGYRGFRYVELTGFPGKPGPSSVQAVFAHTDLKPTASFSCSSDMVNRLYAISVHTQAMGMLGQLVDCVHREQSQWAADAEMQSGNVFYDFTDPSIVKKTLLDLRDGQFADGRLPANYPSMPPFQYYIPEWDMHYLSMLWRTYYYYDDTAILADCWPAVRKMLAFYAAQRDGTGLITKSHAWHINDWPEDYARMDGTASPILSSGSTIIIGPILPHGFAKYLTVENCLYYNALATAARIAGVLGHADDAAAYRAMAEEVKNGINLVLYDPASHAYRDCSGSKKHHAGASALALQFGIVPDAEVPAVIAHVRATGVQTSTYLMYNLVEALYDNDQGDYAYQLLTRADFPGFGYMLNHGATATWEGWRDYASRAHPFNAYWSRYLVSGVVGIKPAAPGWKVIAVRPHVDGLEWARASLKTVAGPIAASWEKTASGLKLKVTIPANAMAKISAPVPSGAAKIYEGDTLIWSEGKSMGTAPDVSFDAAEKNYVDFTVRSGTYNFRVLQ